MAARSTQPRLAQPAATTLTRTLASLLALAFAALLALCLAGPALADDAQNTDNLVDPNLMPDSSFIYETSIYDLQTSDTYYESRRVQINGEVVGDLIYDELDSNKRWITVSALPSEKPSAIQVQISADQAQLIDSFGKYQVTGSTVSVVGTYHLVCNQHDGLSDLHAETLTVTKAGSTQHTSFDIRRFLPALGLALMGFGLFLLYRRKREGLR